jgi:hypothetical protein
VFTTVTNDGYGTYWLLNGRFSSNDGSISINQFTRHQQDLYGNYNPNTDWNNSPLSKFENVTGWTQLQHSWNAPGANTNSRAEAIWKFLGTNVNNLMQLAAIFGGPEDDGLLAADDALSTSAEETGRVLYRVLRDDENPAVGLFAKDPGANQPIWSHVLNGSKEWYSSQYISSTRNLAKAIELASSRNGLIAAIDESKIIGTTIDISTPSAATAAGLGGRAYSLAIHWQEVLIAGEVPPGAVNWVRPVSDWTLWGP